jgi:hypothetical protein
MCRFLPLTLTCTFTLGAEKDGPDLLLALTETKFEIDPGEVVELE